MISHGHGVYLFDKDGKQYLDGSGGPLVVNVGHGRSEIVQAMAEQAQSAAYVHAIMFTSEPLETYAREFATTLPLPDPRLFFLSSGSEVVEGAIKLARQIQMARGRPDRHLIVSRWQSYHGTTLGALSVSGRQGLRAPYLNMLHDVLHVAPPYPYRDPASGEDLASQLEETIEAHGAENIAAFIAEPVSGASLGAVVPPPDYWPAIREICDRHDILLIADEVLSGMGRCGHWWAINQWDITPDILVASKGIAGGYFPLGAIAARGSDVDLIQEQLGDFNHGGTFSHHAVGAAAGLATLRIMQNEKLVPRAATVGERIGVRLRDALAGHPHVGDIRGQGFFWALELVRDRDSKTPFPAADQVAWRVWQRAFDLGLIVYYSQGCADGRNGDLLMLGPPLITTEAQLDEMIARLASAVEQELRA
jgi:adenosylmethionine-8-amino-7-oxononanoate aminotransferase